MRAIRLNKSIEIFFVILIILGLCISAVVLMNAGKNAYERIIDNNNQLENARISLSYLSMRIRQNNTEDGVLFLSEGPGDKGMVKLIHSGDFSGMVTYIYYSDGSLREIFTWADGEPDPEFSEEIVSLDGLDIDYTEGYFKFTAQYTEDGKPKKLEQIVGVVGN